MPRGSAAISPTRAAAVDRSFPSLDAEAAIVADGRGGWVIAGLFSCVGEVAASGLVRLTAAGKVDASWKPKLRGGIGGGEFVRFGNTLYLAGGDGVAALAVEDGRLRWVVRANGLLGVTAMAVGGSRVYVGGDFTRIGGRRKHRLAAINRRTGEVLAWSAPTVVGDVGALAIDGRDLYVGGVRTGRQSNLVKLVARTGRVAAWTPATQRGLTPGSGIPVVEEMVVSHGVVVTTGLRGWQVTDARTGAVREWMYTVVGKPDDLAVAGDRLYLAAGCHTGLLGVAGRRRYNLAAVRLPSGRPIEWVPDIGPRWAINAFPRICIDAIVATRKRVVVAASPGP